MKVFMIVDNSPAIRKVTRRILERMGYIVREAEEGMEALDVCIDNMPDIIMVDWDIPGMTGVEFIKAFRLLDKSDQTKILFCTSRVMTTEMLRAKRAGCQGYILKPFTREILERKLSVINL